ncbi:aspartyl-phosphate phosphatase Spo0E family protein [Priestia megaterium]|uniref:aspartyl-phosphate phosphatase Spo0E family protein n=1 Tax=Priestia megaterium TaxID=1404 RepID=UPI0006ABD9AA|nr:aspartyl-phosphate phosphatase Spo0E family protein [Priestia megaterium]KOP70793.1 hypothetical protein AMS61_26060 [Bacillus sp. FJAT-21351]MUL34078.1 Spo0E like sporulation regulatory protein [Priestia megaterium]
MSMVVNPVGQIKDLQKCIVKKRRELVDLGSTYGLLDEKTIKCSQDLDKLINLHMKSYSSSTGNYKGSDFKYEIKAVELASSNMRFCSAQLIAHSNLATFGVCTALVLVGNGTKAGFITLQNLRQLTTHP